MSARASSSNRLTSWPLRMYFPEVGLSKHPSMFINVDLPEPEGPIKATYSLVWMSKSNPSRA